ncbi:MAG: transporter [Proteobacteria bacterium]|nr:transporter [Pseudomonadota bacterium]
MNACARPALRPLLLALAAASASPLATASCGQAFCSINTNWHAQGVWTEPGLRLDLQYQFIDQDQLRRGSHEASVGDVPRHHDELRTINRNWLGTLDYSIDPRWGVSVTMPVTSRSHSHVHNHHEDDGSIAHETEAWNFSRVGDLRVVGRYQFMGEGLAPSAGVNFGVKLPTGSHKVENGDGERAERSLQPGTGTTDAIVGAWYRLPLNDGDSALFAQAMAQVAVGQNDGFRPGNQYSVDVGWQRQLAPQWAAFVQANFQLRSRDSGIDAEPEDSGSRKLFLSPGLSYAIARDFQVYAFAQLPVRQHVNGVQLTADWAAMLGVSKSF